MRFFDLIFNNKETTYIGIRYHATGIFGYSFRIGEKEVFTLSCPVLPNPEIFMRGFNKELVHENFEEQMTLMPGIRRNIVDRDGKTHGCYEYLTNNEYRIITDRVVASVKVFENGWDIYQGKTKVADIHRIPESDRAKYEENGFDMEEYFQIKISMAADSELYPYIMAAPVLGF